MGCDGGTIPKRCELVREKQKPEKVDKEIELNAKWFHCAISQEELREPIVSCELGNLYRKESVLEFLLDKSKATSDVARHIRSLKDVKELVLTKKNGGIKKQVNAADLYLDYQDSDHICPISGLEMNGRYRFCFSWKCGCAFSERGLKEVPSTTCHNCGTLFEQEDVVVMNGNATDVERMRERMTERRLKAKEQKKAKKSKRRAEENGDSSDAPKEVAKKAKFPSQADKNVASTSVNGKEPSSSKLANGKAPILKPSSTKTNEKGGVLGSEATFSRYKTVAANPEASKVYKSLFSSSHKEDPNRKKSNWVTYHSYHC